MISVMEVQPPKKKLRLSLNRPSKGNQSTIAYISYTGTPNAPDSAVLEVHVKDESSNTNYYSKTPQLQQPIILFLRLYHPPPLTFQRDYTCTADWCLVSFYLGLKSLYFEGSCFVEVFIFIYNYLVIFINYLIYHYNALKFPLSMCRLMVLGSENIFPMMAKMMILPQQAQVPTAANLLCLWLYHPPSLSSAWVGLSNKVALHHCNKLMILRNKNIFPMLMAMTIFSQVPPSQRE